MSRTVITPERPMVGDRPARGPRPCPECSNQFGGMMPGHVYGSNWDWVPCQTCHRDGQLFDIIDAPCWNCDTTGEVALGGLPDDTSDLDDCPTCDGTGTVPARVDAEPKPIGIANTQGSEVWTEWRTKVTDINEESP